MADTSARYPPRRWYRKVPFCRAQPRPEPVSVPGNDGANPVTPEVDANWFSLVTFAWLHNILKIGYTRPLVADEIYSMPDHRRAQLYSEKLEESWARRCLEAERLQQQPARTIPFWTLAWWHITRADIDAKKLARRQPKPSLVWTLNDVVLQWFWVGGIFKLIGDLAIITSPLMVRAVIETLPPKNQQPESPQESSYQEKRGFGLAAGLFVLLVVSVFFNVHGFYRSYSTGIALRGALIHTIYKRSCHLSEKARTQDGYSLGKLMSLVSADVSRIDFACGYIHVGWTSIIQILVCLALMIWTLGYSALPGFALVALLYPVQTRMVKKLFSLRRASMPFTDSRIKAIVEAVASIRLVKTYAWEVPLLQRVSKIRSGEMGYLRKRLLLRSVNTAVSFSVPTLAAVVSFVCYAGTGHSLESGKIFSSLTFFLLLRTPLQMLPVALSSFADASAAIERLTAFMLAHPRKDDVISDESMPEMVRIRNALFIHHDEDETSGDTDDEKESLDSTRLEISNLEIKRGQFVAIVGPVGSGKSSLLRALIGDMRISKAEEVRLGAPTAYCPQSAWLLSASVKENILFGRPYDEQRYQDTLRRCCLAPDLATLSHGDATVVGEKGISLSGGQKQRISIARAVYSADERPLRLLDDCFSALDAHVGAQVFKNIIADAKQYTHVLATHSLVFAAQADHIVYMEGGVIREQGTFEDLMANGQTFSKLMEGAGLTTSNPNLQDNTSEDANDDTEQDNTSEDTKNTATEADAPTRAQEAMPADPKAEPKEQESDPSGKKVTPTDIMQKEERLVGSVTIWTYVEYILLGKAPLTVPLFITSIVAYQAATILSPLWLSWWEEKRWAYISQDTYMGVYAALGVGQALGLFCMSASFALFAFYVSQHLHAKAAKRILYAPISFFDTTPQGRITHRFSKDIDAIDNVIGETLRLFISTTVQALGSIILVAIILPEFLAIAAAVLLAYVWVGMFYRPTSRELRRLNNVLRSKIYEHFSESLSGITTLRAYGAVAGFETENARRIDSENRAYWLSIACQRWLNVRLDFLGACLCLGTALLVVGLRTTINPSQGGVVLSYMVSVQAVFGHMIRQSAEIENNMNSIERLLHYANKVEQEAPHDQKSDAELVQEGWPAQGRIQYADLTASHRSDLPPALKQVDLDIRAGEKIGVVGRTGAGKTTLLSALLRMMEASQGRILIDGKDIRHIGLNILRRSISVISQDAVLFAGSLRYNLDPFGERQDAELWDVLKQAKLVHTSEEKVESGRVTLDMEIAAEGANLSQGQRALVSVARALVRRSRIVVLDEATASIDTVTDAAIQETLRTSLRDCTVLTVAHRLNTVVGNSDRICVMDKGSVVECDSPQILFAQQGSIFRQLCESASINAEDIERMRASIRRE
ncbi:unnamed protein product [Sympodiomycopsis kandeliae]